MQQLFRNEDQVEGALPGKDLKVLTRSCGLFTEVISEAISEAPVLGLHSKKEHKIQFSKSLIIQTTVC